jgi:hypothetical protein
VGHVRSGVVGGGPGRCLPPIDYEGEDGPAQVRYRCRARLGRGGRIVFDRVPLAAALVAAQPQKQPPAQQAPQTPAPAGEGAAAAAQENVMPPPPPPPGAHLQHPHAPAYHPLPADAITVTLSAAAGGLGPQLERYPTCDLLAADLFKYPTRFPEIAKLEDQEDEVLEADPAALCSDPDPLLVLPPRPRPPQTDSVALLRFQLRV